MLFCSSAPVSNVAMYCDVRHIVGLLLDDESSSQETSGAVKLIQTYGVNGCIILACYENDEIRLFRYSNEAGMVQRSWLYADFPDSNSNPKYSSFVESVPRVQGFQCIHVAKNLHRHFANNNPIKDKSPGTKGASNSICVAALDHSCSFCASADREGM